MIVPQDCCKVPCPCLCFIKTQGFCCPWYDYLKPSCCRRHIPQPVLPFPCRLQKREHELQQKAARASAALPGIQASLAEAHAQTAAIAQKAEGLRQRRQRLQVGSGPERGASGRWTIHTGRSV